MPTLDKEFAGGVTTMSTPLLRKVRVCLINRLCSTSIPPENRNYRNGKLVENGLLMLMSFFYFPTSPIFRYPELGLFLVIFWPVLSLNVLINFVFTLKCICSHFHKMTGQNDFSMVFKSSMPDFIN